MTVSQPNLTNIRLWIDALRSGEYKQGLNRLTTILPDGTQHDCCLGVACKLAMKNAVALAIYYESLAGDVNVRRVHYNSAFSLMPQAVSNWLGVPYWQQNTNNGDVTIDFPVLEDRHYHSEERSVTLSWMNDKGMSFSQIADVLEWYFFYDEPKASQ